MESKVCRKCLETKPADEFPKANHGHWCKPCWSAYYRNWVATHQEQDRAAKRRWKRLHPEQARADARKRYYRDAKRSKAYLRELYARDPERHIRYSRKWQLTHPEQVRMNDSRWKKTEKGRAVKRRGGARRRGLLAVQPNDLSAEDWQKALLRFNNRCAYCLESLVKATQDHIIPIHVGGGHTKSNVVPACQPCNSKWGDRIEGKVELLRANWPLLFPIAGIAPKASSTPTPITPYEAAQVRD